MLKLKNITEYNVDNEMIYFKRCILFGNGNGHINFVNKNLIKINLPILIKLNKFNEVLSIIVKASLNINIINQDIIIYSLAYLTLVDNNDDNKSALKVIYKVCRNPTHLFMLIKYRQDIGKTKGWGRSFRNVISEWYLKKNPFELSKYVINHPEFYGWSNQDVIRCCHPKPKTAAHDLIFSYLLQGKEALNKRIISKAKPKPRKHLSHTVKEDPLYDSVRNYFLIIEELKTCNLERTIEIINNYNELGLNYNNFQNMLYLGPNFYIIYIKKIVPKMTLTEILKNYLYNEYNLRRIYINDKYNFIFDLIIKKLSDVIILQIENIHPFNIFRAWFTIINFDIKNIYSTIKLGTNINELSNLLISNTFKLCIKYNIKQKNNKKGFQPNYYFALNISKSMNSMLNNFNEYDTLKDKNIIELSCLETLIAICLIFRQSNNNDMIFSTFTKNSIQLDFSKSDQNSIRTNIFNKINELDYSSHTVVDFVKPVNDAIKLKKYTDCFVIITNSYHKSIQQNLLLSEALGEYRKKFNSNAKFISIELTGKTSLVTEVNDFGILHIVGFNTHVIDIIMDFAAGI